MQISPNKIEEFLQGIDKSYLWGLVFPILLVLVVCIVGLLIGLYMEHQHEEHLMRVWMECYQTWGNADGS